MQHDGSANDAAGERVRVTEQANVQDLAVWDRFVDGVPFADVTQLSAWSKLRAKAGFSALHVFVERDGQLVGGAQVLRRRVRAAGSLGYLSGGPLLAPGLDDRAGVVETLGAALQGILGHASRVLFVQPPDGAHDVSAELLRRGFRPSEAGIAPAASLRIDLGQDEERLRARLNKRLRSWTRRWPDKGVVVRIGDDEDLPLLADLLARSATVQGYEPLSYDYLRSLYLNLARSGNAVLFVGEVRGVPVAADLYTRCGGVLRDRLIGFDRDGEATNLSVPAALKWYAMLWARERGLRWFDFGGIGIQNAEALLAGQLLDQATAGGSDFFKISFGGDPVVMPRAVEDARPRQALRLYDLLQGSDRGRTLVAAMRRRLRAGSAATNRSDGGSN